jgi:alkylation response protein AidB-like acyl-CoA dehydrogenase
VCHIDPMQNTRLQMLDHDLGPEIDLLRNTVRDFAEDKIAPIAVDLDRGRSGRIAGETPAVQG